MKKLIIILCFVALISLHFSDAYIPLEVNDNKINMDETQSGDGIFTFNKEITDSEIDKLLDKTIVFNGAEYDIEEEILVNLEVDLDKGYKNDVKYSYVFSESIDLTKASIYNPLEIEVIGEKLKIVDIVLDDSFKVEVGKEYEFDSGDSISAFDKGIKLVRVGSAGAIVVDVDGVTQTIASNSIKTINGIEIFNKWTYYDSNNQAASSAVLIVGKEVFKTYKGGDSYEGNPLWGWYIGNLKDKSGHYIGVKNNPDWNKIDSEKCVNLQMGIWIFVCLI